MATRKAGATAEAEAGTREGAERGEAGAREGAATAGVPVLAAERFTEFREYLERVGFKFEERPHQRFLARCGNLVVSLYKSGKVVIGGRDRQLEREVRWYLTKLGASAGGEERLPKELASVSGATRIGTDEAGKGDYFGPLVVAGALVDEGGERALRALGARDSKKLSDARVMALDREIRKGLGDGGYEVLRIDPQRYNSLYSEMGDLDRMLAWAHSRVIENLLKAHPDCRLVVVDRFSAASLEAALMEKGREVRVVQAVRGERDPAVAAASIMARAEFLRQIERLGRENGVELPRGANAVEAVARQLIERHGKEVLSKLAKLHFRTTEKVLDTRE